VTGRRGRRRRKLLDDLKERKGYSHLKEEALDRTMWRARFGPVVRHYQMKDCAIPIVVLLADRWRSNARAVVFRHRTALHHGMSVFKRECTNFSQSDFFSDLTDVMLQVHDQFSSDHIPQLSLLSYYTT